jgi:hypothetical protein
MCMCMCICMCMYTQDNVKKNCPSRLSIAGFAASHQKAAGLIPTAEIITYGLLLIGRRTPPNLRTDTCTNTGQDCAQQIGRMHVSRIAEEADGFLRVVSDSKVEHEKHLMRKLIQSPGVLRTCVLKEVIDILWVQPVGVHEL